MNGKVSRWPNTLDVCISNVSYMFYKFSSNLMLWQWLLKRRLLPSEQFGNCTFVLDPSVLSTVACLVNHLANLQKNAIYVCVLHAYISFPYTCTYIYIFYTSSLVSCLVQCKTLLVTYRTSRGRVPVRTPPNPSPTPETHGLNMQ